MDTSTLQSTKLFFSLAPGTTALLFENPDGTAELRGIEVFKSGTFRDSNGVQDTWTPDHLTMLVSNFNLLKESGIFPDVPWRKGHNRNVDNVVGYIMSLATDGVKLRADVALTEPDAVAKYKRGTYRARSAEIGVFQANDDAIYWPTVLGVAFVDVPAVQGLYSHPQEEPVAFVILDKEDPAVPENMTEAQFAAACNYAAWIEAHPQFPEGPSQWEQAACYAQGLVDAKPAAGTPAVHTFSLNGTATTDFAAVQAHVASLEKFAADTRDANRAEFVSKLADANKIAHAQVESLKAHALTLNDDQFAAFKASYDAAPVLSLFDRHAAGVTNPNGDAKPGDDEKSILEGSIRQHRLAGMPEDQIKQTKSYQRLQSLQATA